MTEILLTGTLSLNSINQINIFLKLKSIKYSYLSILAAVFGFRQFELKKRFKCLNVKRRLRFIGNSHVNGSSNRSTIRVRLVAEFRPRLEAARPVLPLNGSYHKVSTEIAGTKEAQARQWRTQFWCQRNNL